MKIGSGPLPVAGALIVILVAGAATVISAAISPVVAETSTSGGPVVACTTNSNIFNTGYDSATGGVLSDTSQDANWQVSGPYFAQTDGTSPLTATSYPATADVFTPANVGDLAPGGYANSPYGNAQWISQQTVANNNQGTGDNNGDWYYRYLFSLAPSVDPGTFSLAISFMADNEVAQVWVNGAPQSGLTSGIPQAPAGSNPYDYQGYVLANAGAMTLANDWQTGENSIVVQIKSGPPLEAFLAQVRPSTLCPTVTLSSSVTSRFAPSDQFKATLTNAAGDQLAAATTQGSQSTATATSVYLAEGASYTIADAIAPGSPDTMADYTYAASCTNETTNQAVQLTGAGPTWTFIPLEPADYSCQVTNTADPVVGLGISQTSTPATYQTGGPITYTVRVTNSGPDQAVDASVTDALPPALRTAMSFTCVASGGSSCTPTGTGPLADTVTVAVGGVLQYTLTGTVPDGTVGQLENVAVVTPASGEVDPACQQGCQSVNFNPVETVRLALSATLNPHQPVVGYQLKYTFVVRNYGPAAADGMAVDALVPPALRLGSFQWSCVASPGSGCSAAGAGDLSGLATLPVGGSATFSFSGNLPGVGPEPLDITFTVTPSAGTTDPGCGSGCSAVLAASVSAPVPNTGAGLGDGLAMVATGIALLCAGVATLRRRGATA